MDWGSVNIPFCLTNNKPSFKFHKYFSVAALSGKPKGDPGSSALFGASPTNLVALSITFFNDLASDFWLDYKVTFKYYTMLSVSAI